jgi:hypothetical protein
LSLLTVLSRLPYRTRIPYNWDAVQFALALSEYDIEKHQPHPPGYILYVALGRLVNAWLADPTASYVVLAVAFSGLTTFVVYSWPAVYDRPTALAAASPWPSARSWFWAVGSPTRRCCSSVAHFSYRALREPPTPGSPRGTSAGRRHAAVDPTSCCFRSGWARPPLGTRRLRTALIGLGILAVAVLAWFIQYLAERSRAVPRPSRKLAGTVVKPTSVVGGPR